MRFIKRYILVLALEKRARDLMHKEALLDACVLGGFRDVRINPLHDMADRLEVGFYINHRNEVKDHA